MKNKFLKVRIDFFFDKIMKKNTNITVKKTSNIAAFLKVKKISKKHKKIRGIKNCLFLTFSMYKKINVDTKNEITAENEK